MDTNPFAVPVQVEAPQEVKKNFPCPECPRSFDAARILGAHRRLYHGILGTSYAAAKARDARAKSEQAPERRKGGRPRGSFTQPQPVKEQDQPQALAPSRPVLAIPDVLVGYAIGKYESLVETIAREHNLPATEFKIRCGMMMSTGIVVKM